MWMQSSSNYFIAKVNRHFSKEWHVTIFIVDHNHELLPLRVYDFFPTNRAITEVDKNRILLFKEAGL